MRKIILLVSLVFFNSCDNIETNDINTIHRKYKGSIVIDIRNVSFSEVSFILKDTTTKEINSVEVNYKYQSVYKIGEVIK